MVSNAHMATLAALAVAMMYSSAAMAANGSGHQANQAKPAIKNVVKTKATAKKDVYVCPMHPEVTSAKADDRCPKCGMFLEKKK